MASTSTTQKKGYTFVCKKCSSEFTRYSKHKYTYCSRACFNNDKKRVTKTCLNCENTFQTYPSYKKQFCSYDCAHAMRRRSSKPELSLKPYLEPLGFRNTNESPCFLTNKSRGRTRVPDYINSSERKIVEVWGEYWHRDRVLPNGERHETVDECVQWYKEIGWDCQVVWVNDLESFKESLVLERVA